MFQIDQNAREDFNLTSDGEFNGIKSLVLGKVHGKWEAEAEGRQFDYSAAGNPLFDQQL